ncbi:protein kinase [Planctomycetota bacterium]
MASSFCSPSRHIQADGEGGAPQVPGYEIERRLGRGASGTVYLARESGGSRRLVALKLFAPEQRQAYERELTALATVEEVRRREREIHIVQSLDASTFAGRSYVAFEYMEGGSLGDLVDREGVLGYGRAVRLESVSSPLGCPCVAGG